MIGGWRSPRAVSPTVTGAGFKGVFIGTMAEKNAVNASILSQRRQALLKKYGSKRGGGFGSPRAPVLNRVLPAGMRFARPAGGLDRDF